MSTITREFTKEQLQQIIETDHVQCGEASALARIALASLEAEPVAYSLIFRNMDGVLNDYVNANTTFSTIEKAQAYGRGGNYVRQNDGSLQWVSDPSLDPVVVPLFTAPPAPVSVPDAMEMDDDFDSAFEHGKAVGWNAYRAAMLQSFGNSEQLNSPVIPDGWVACSDRLPDPDSAFRVCAYTPTPHEDFRFRSVPASLFKSVCRDATHWQYMLPPAAPQQE
ncbi:MAG: hypothetical protein E7B94_09660 [Enterobacter sp.]|nr:hypothetical protein [Enterobacter sp.]